LDELRVADPTDEVVFVSGRDAPGDGGGGFFVWSESRNPDEYDRGTGKAEKALYVRSVNSDAGIWLRVSEQAHIDVRWFGAGSEGTREDSQAINEALWVSGASNVLHTYIPEDTYSITDPIRITDWGSGHLIRGDGILSTKLEKQGEETVTLPDGTPQTVDACLAIDRFDTGKEIVDFYGAEIRDLSLVGAKDSPSSESHGCGIYIKGANRLEIERVQFSYFSTALFARKLWMSSLKHLKAAHVGRFIVVGGTEQMLDASKSNHDSEEPDNFPGVPSSTSLRIANCFCTRNVHGDAFFLNKVFYSTLLNCGADHVRGWPYHIRRSRGVTLQGCGFEWSESGCGVWFEGSSGTVIGIQGLNIHPNRTEQDGTTPLRLSEDVYGRGSSVTLMNSYLGEFVDEKNQQLDPSEIKGSDNPNLRLSGTSRLVIVDSRITRNGEDALDSEEGREAQLVVHGGNLAQNSGLQVHDFDEGRSGLTPSVKLGGEGVSVSGDPVVGERKDAVGRLDMEVEDTYDPEQLRAVRDKLNEVLDVLGGSSGHGLTDD
jgi:hypothetical protein